MLVAEVLVRLATLGPDDHQLANSLDADRVGDATPGATAPVGS
jgi:hypothetical protein